MPRFRHFDPYKEDKERQLHERGLEHKKAREAFRLHPLSPKDREFAALSRRKKPVSLAPVK